jgi:hypothetical protein
MNTSQMFLKEEKGGYKTEVQSKPKEKKEKPSKSSKRKLVDAVV